MSHQPMARPHAKREASTSVNEKEPFVRRLVVAVRSPDFEPELGWWQLRCLLSCSLEIHAPFIVHCRRTKCSENKNVRFQTVLQVPRGRERRSARRPRTPGRLESGNRSSNQRPSTSEK